MAAVVHALVFSHLVSSAAASPGRACEGTACEVEDDMALLQRAVAHSSIKFGPLPPTPEPLPPTPGPLPPTPSIHDSLLAMEFNTYPDSSTTLEVGGVVTVHREQDKAVDLTWALSGADPQCTKGAAEDIKNGCGVHIHEGMTCEDASLVGGHYWKETATQKVDPWLPVKYVAESVAYQDGVTSPVSLSIGYDFLSIAGRALVVHDFDGNRVACALAKYRHPSLIGANSFKKYPGAQTVFNVRGSVTVKESSRAPSIEMGWHLKDFDPRCTAGAADDIKNGCGIHVHVGKSCEDAGEIGGHYWNSSSTILTSDPWLPIKYAISDIEAFGHASVNMGHDLDSARGRAVVVHDHTGARVACSLLIESGGSPP